MNNDKFFDRRSFLKVSGMLTLASAVPFISSSAQTEEKNQILILENGKISTITKHQNPT